MREISRKEAMEQARGYAQEMINFLNQQNTELRSSNRPRTDRAKIEERFEQLYLRHIAEHFVIVP